MPPKGRSKAQTAPRPAEKPRDAVPQSASQPSTSGALPVVDPLLVGYPHVDALMLKVRAQAANSDIPSGASAAMGWLEEFSSKLQKIRENPMAEDVVLPPPTTARKTAPRKTVVRKATTRKAATERAEAVPSGAKRRTRAADERARKLAEETQEIVIVDEVQVTEVIQIVSERIVVEEKTGEGEEEVKPVPAKRRTTRKKSSAVKRSPKLESVEIIIPSEAVAKPPVVAEPPVVEAKPEEVSQAIVPKDHPLEAIEERPTAEGQTSLPSAQEDLVGDGDVSMHMITPEPAENPVEEAVEAGTTEVSEKDLMEVEQVSGQEEKQREGEKVEPASAEVEDEWVVVDEKGDNTRLLEAFAVDGEKTASQEEARPAEEVKRQRGSKEPSSKDKGPTVANEERSRSVALERMRARDAERAKKAAEKREELERARQAKVEAHLLEKGKKSKLSSTTQRQQEAERRRKEELERYMKLAAKPLTEGSPVRQTHYSGMKAASAAKATTPSKPSALSLGDVQKTPPKLPSWQNATSTSTSKQSSQTVSHQPAKGFKQVPAGTKIFTPLQMPRVNVDGLRVAQKHVTDRAGSSQKTAVPAIPSLDSLRTNLTDSQHKASQPTASTSATNHSSSGDGNSQESQRGRAMSPLMRLVKKPPSGLKNGEKVKEGEPESDSLVRQTASMSLKDKDDVSMAEAPRQAEGLDQVDKDKDQETEAKKNIEVQKKDEGVKQPSLPVAAVRQKLISPRIINGGCSKEDNDQPLTAANSTFIYVPRSADQAGLSTTSDVQPKQPSVELTGSTFSTSAFQAAKSVFSNLTNPFSAFQSHTYSAKPEVPSSFHTEHFPVLPQEKEKPFSTFKMEEPTNNMIPQPSSSSHLDTLKSTNPFLTFCQSEKTSKAPSSCTAFSALSPKGEKLTFCNLQSSTFVSVSSKSHLEGAKSPQPFFTVHPEPQSNPSSNSSTNGFAAVAGPPTAVKVDMPSQKLLPTTSHKVPSVVEVISSKPPEKHNSKKRPAEDVQTYGLDIQQDDDTDDEDNPRKVVPKWAESANLSALMRKQLCREIDLDMTFEGARPSEKVALGAIFQAPEARYNKRTSSQMWTHPPLALGVYTPHGHLKHVKEGLENIEDV
ncbi:hypothetical protein RvY_18329 [Ramazzottius varieornatus]|uniref:Inner centromere protein ARK-binding domain-containing protein n=1 Tax=Ramazzottius varieornatus TaxID=947166 RepID=A0A1D1W5C9_RAMVA|nr:hypothetical protein RvY_18329 [Ramazzottius varieornatus]